VRSLYTPSDTSSAAGSLFADACSRHYVLTRHFLACRFGKLVQVSGKAAPKKRIFKQLIDADFNPDEWDKQMASAFGNDYYAEAEHEDDVRADAHDIARDMSSWVDADAAGVQDGVSFASLHARVTGSADAYLPETDYEISGTVPEHAGLHSINSGSARDRVTRDDDRGDREGQYEEGAAGQASAAERRQSKEKVCSCVQLLAPATLLMAR
jgi:hypothetical protein